MIYNLSSIEFGYVMADSVWSLYRLHYVNMPICNKSDLTVVKCQFSDEKLQHSIYVC